MLVVFKRLDDLARVQAKGAILLILGGIKDFLRIHAAGNKSGALLLTIRALINQRGDERFTRRQRSKRRHRVDPGNFTTRPS
jgi:hypothetical protein